MSITETQTLLAFLPCIVIVSTAAVYLAPLRNYNNGGSEAKSGYEQSLGNGPARPPRNLGSNDIVKLLDDLDNQTEAIKNGQEIGDGLLNGKNQTTTKEQKMNWRENSSTGYSQEESSTSDDQQVTDVASQAVAIAEAPALVDTNGIPEKTTAIENGVSYLTGKPLLVLDRENKDPDMDKWFLYYPLFTDSDKQIP